MAIEKTYTDDATKKLWRRKVFDFVSTHSSRERLRESRVLCLPGHEMMEIFEIYDALGIKRRSIYGLEGNYEVFRELKRKNDSLDEKINIISSSVGSWVKRKGLPKFDIVSLDYTNYFNPEKAEMLKMFSQRGLLGESPMILTNYPQGKIVSHMQKCMEFSKQYESSRYKKGELRNFLMERGLPLLKDKQRLGDSEEYDPSSDIAIQMSPVECLLDPGLECSSLFNGWKKGRENGKQKKEFSRCIREMEEKDGYSEELIRYFFFSKENLGPQRLALMLYTLENAYFPEDHRAYVYTSSSGSKMLSDLYLFKRNPVREYVSELLKDPSFFKFSEGSLEISPDEKLLDKLPENLLEKARALCDMLSANMNRILENFPEKRTDLTREGRA